MSERDDPTARSERDDPTARDRLVALVEHATGSPLAVGTNGVTLSARGDDIGPLSAVAATLQGTATVVGVIPRLVPSLLPTIPEEGAALDSSPDLDAIEGRIVLVGAARDRLDGPAGAAIRPLLADRPVDLLVAPGDSPVGILLADDRVIVGWFDAEGLAAVLVTDAEAVREWGVGSVRRYLDAADPI
ncbi:transcriptional regulator FilR1 domain-containing protein [Halorubrum vacuolatum]|uniref:Methanogenesis regulatory protein FilR1 middle domain-containing protein n=1 Tax=Halorubrum vacuolatum TaxID=63740 RepID=A0A238X4M0_HALVU|nr:hypothetical protein [Halorubrum vacuolatum]SNR52799.1 hypothetical protein SAMN06264855_11270 [Halorubrum vacuolatum]